MATVLNTQARAEIMHDQGRLDDAIRTYRQAIGRLEELGQAGFRSTTLISLAAVLYDCGQPDEAARLAVEGERVGAAEDVVNFANGRALRARIAADQGAHDNADSLARQALGYAYKTDMPRAQATAHEALAHVLSAVGTSTAHAPNWNARCNSGSATATAPKPSGPAPCSPSLDRPGPRGSSQAVARYAGCPFMVTCAPVASVTRAAPNSWPAVHAPGLAPARTRRVVSAAIAAVARTPSPVLSSAVRVCPSRPLTSAQV